MEVNDITNMLNSCGLNVTTIDLVDNNTKCMTCQCMYMVQEMASRIWTCPNCGKTGFKPFVDLINKYAKIDMITYEESWNLANNLLIFKQEECESKHKIYFDEDYFYNDLLDFYKRRKLNKFQKILRFLRIKQ
jgi:acetyl-CoA carboxylase beta subunit